jgi:PKD repeat protein
MRRLEDVQLISTVPRALCHSLMEDSMRSIRMLAALVLGSACGGDNGPGPDENDPPVAIFTAPSCTVAAPCAFTADPSNDDNAVTGWKWDFNGDGTDEFTTKDASFTFQTQGSVPVRLIVSDAEGLADTVINNVNVAAAANTLPTAGFTYSCTATNCTFTNTSTDTDGTIASYAWDFGDPTSGAANTSTAEDPTHTFSSAATYTVTLTVTDNAGGTDVETQTLPVTQDLVCTGGDCTIVLTSASAVTISVDAANCQFIGNKFEIVEPIAEVVFTDGCTLSAGDTFTLQGGTAFGAGTNLLARFTQGTKPRPADPDPGPASTRVSGAFPEWTIEFDDGGNAGAPGEPDFNDIVLTVTATP